MKRSALERTSPTVWTERLPSLWAWSPDSGRPGRRQPGRLGQRGGDRYIQIGVDGLEFRKLKLKVVLLSIWTRPSHKSVPFLWVLDLPVHPYGRVMGNPGNPPLFRLWRVGLVYVPSSLRSLRGLPIVRHVHMTAFGCSQPGSPQLIRQ